MLYQRGSTTTDGSPALVGTARIIKVFLASPGDVAEERAFVRELLGDSLRRDPLWQEPITFDLIAWDHPHGAIPMVATITPQEAITRYGGRPADCDIVIVILWTRLGTHLDMTAFPKPGGRYESGTEWEYEDAVNSPKKPTVLVYRRTTEVLLNPDHPDHDERTRQRRLVTSFLSRFKNPDGSFNGMSNPYDDLDGFKRQITDHLKRVVLEQLSGASTVSLPADTKPVAAVAVPIPRPDACIGRDGDIDAILAALTPGAAVLVHGPGGIGKTTITHHVAHVPVIRERFGGRIWEAELETARDRDSFDGQMLRGLDLDLAQGFAAAVARLSQAPALLVLDNLETAWEGDPTGIESRLGQLAAIPGLGLLASFRGDEPVRGAPWTRLPIEPLHRDDARALFLLHAGTGKANDPDLPALLSALGDIPLAICLLATRASRHDTLARLWAEWQRVGTSVARLAVGDPNRLTSVVHSIELTLASSRMTAPARRLFAILGQCPAGLTPEDASALLDGEDALAAEEALLGLGLAHRRDGRLDLLPPVRDHARRAHPPQGKDATAWCRHFLTRTRTEGGRILGDGGAEFLAVLTSEVPNIDAAFRAAPKLALREPAVGALAGIYRLLSTTGAGTPAVLDELAQACCAAGDLRGEAESHYWRALISFYRSDLNIALARYEEALPLYRSVGDVVGEAACIRNLGDIARIRSDHDSALVRYEEALILYRRVGDVVGEAACIRNLGNIALRRSDHNGARTRYRDALLLFRRVGDVLGEATCINSLGHIARISSDHDSALALYMEAFPLFRQVGAVLGEANCIQSIGDIALRRSDHDSALARYEEALPLFRRVGAVLGEANCIRGQGRVAEATGDKAAAKTCYLQSLVLYERIHHVDNIAITHTDLAGVTVGADRALHVAAAVAAWRSMGLEDEAIRVERRFSDGSGAA